MTRPMSLAEGDDNRLKCPVMMEDPGVLASHQRALSLAYSPCEYCGWLSAPKVFIDDTQYWMKRSKYEGVPLKVLSKIEHLKFDDVDEEVQ